MQDDVYQTVRLMSVQEMVGGTKDYFGWKSRFGAVSGAKSMVMTLSMNWMHEASNGTSSETGDHGKDEPDVDEEKSEQSDDGSEDRNGLPGHKKWDCWELEKNAHLRPYWWKSKKNCRDEDEVSGVELCLASLTHNGCQDFYSAR